MSVWCDIPSQKWRYACANASPRLWSEFHSTTLTKANPPLCCIEWTKMRAKKIIRQTTNRSFAVTKNGELFELFLFFGIFPHVFVFLLKIICQVFSHRRHVGKAFDSCVEVEDMVPRSNCDVRCPFLRFPHFFYFAQKNEREKDFDSTSRWVRWLCEKENDTSSTELNGQYFIVLSYKDIFCASWLVCSILLHALLIMETVHWLQSTAMRKKGHFF